MSLADTSLYEGRPVELFAFQRGLQYWFYTSIGVPVNYDNRRYEVAPIKRSNINLTNDLFKSDLKLTFPRDNAFAREYLGFTPEIPTIVTLLRGQNDVVDGPKDFEILWKGRVISGKGDGPRISLQCEPISTTLRRPGLRARYERNCRHLLYDHNCKVNQEALKFTGEISVINKGVDVSIPSLLAPDGTYTAGILKTASGEMRFITNQVGDTVTVARPISGLAVTNVVDLYPGCDHLKETCINKFNNIENFGGYPYIPVINPLGGGSIV